MQCVYLIAQRGQESLVIFASENIRAPSLCQITDVLWVLKSGPWLLDSRTSLTVLVWLSHCVKQSVQRVKGSEYMEKPLYHCVCYRIKLYDCSLSMQSGSQSTFVLPHIFLVVFCHMYCIYCIGILIWQINCFIIKSFSLLALALLSCYIQYFLMTLLKLSK